MPTVYVRDGESLSSAIQRFSYKCHRAEIIEDCTSHAAFVSDKQRERKKRKLKIRRRELKREARKRRK